MKRTIMIACLLALAGACDRGPADAQTTEEPAAASRNNRIDYVEFAAADLAGFKAFYETAFGWTFEDWGPDYASFSGAGLEGGVRGGAGPTPGSTLVILYADDLDASERAVTAAGGVILERHEFPGGRRFHFPRSERQCARRVDESRRVAAGKKALTAPRTPRPRRSPRRSAPAGAPHSSRQRLRAQGRGFSRPPRGGGTRPRRALRPPDG